MFEALLPALILAKIKHYKIKYLFSTWTFYPILITQLLLLVIQANIFMGNYYFVRFAPAIKIAIPLSFVFAIIIHQIYKPAFVGCGLMMAGTLLNRFVIYQNNGKMPVFPSLSYFTGYVKPDSFRVIQDIHILGSASTHYNFLADYIDIGYSILSPGDILVHFFTFLMLYYLIKAINIQNNL